MGIRFKPIIRCLVLALTLVKEVMKDTKAPNLVKEHEMMGKIKKLQAQAHTMLYKTLKHQNKEVGSNLTQQKTTLEVKL